MAILSKTVNVIVYTAASILAANIINEVYKSYRNEFLSDDIKKDLLDQMKKDQKKEMFDFRIWNFFNSSPSTSQSADLCVGPEDITDLRKKHVETQTNDYINDLENLE